MGGTSIGRGTIEKKPVSRKRVRYHRSKKGGPRRGDHQSQNWGKTKPRITLVMGGHEGTLHIRR